MFAGPDANTAAMVAVCALVGLQVMGLLALLNIDRIYAFFTRK